MTLYSLIGIKERTLLHAPVTHFFGAYLAKESAILDAKKSQAINPGMKLVIQQLEVEEIL